jgi:hypothetical protein
MESTEIKLTLYQKLHKIQSKINGLGKDKDTRNQYNPNGYKYVTGDKVLREVKPLMNELGLLLKQEVISIENQRQDYAVKSGQKSEILSKVMMRFTWIDCETGEKDENLFGANGQNDWEKGLGSALTYAERYFLLKFFHIATDEDDIDNPDRKTSDPIKKKEEPTEYLIPGSKTDTISVKLFDLIQKLNHKDIMLANEINKSLENETGAVKNYFYLVCKSKAMTYNKTTKNYEVIETPTAQ